MAENLMDKVVSLAKRRGFLFQSSEIYGGLESCWDYGPLGVELKRNVREAWWRAVVTGRSDVEGLDAAILMHPRTWEASGHVAGFADPLIDNRVSKARYRADHLIEGHIEKLRKKGKADRAEEVSRRLAAAINDPEELHRIVLDEEIVDPVSGTRDWTPVRKFNLLFKTFMGPVEDEAAVVYLRPETAQGIFVNFLNVLTSSRQRPPFGIAQIGKSFRNEITPGNFIFRTREFEQMELEFFVKPGEDETWHRYWIEERLNWYLGLGVKKDNLRVREHGKDELAHYAKACSDIEYRFPFGWKELEGVANRTDFDLKQHAQYSGKQLTYFDEEEKRHYVPYVIEPSAGADRSVLVFLIDAYAEEEDRVVLRLHPRLAPFKAGVFPLVRKDGMPEKARAVEKRLKTRFNVFYDETGTVGRRYRRQDEAGTPFGITVDSQTLEDDTVTLRERDSMAQVRVPVSRLAAELTRRIEGDEASD